MENILVDLKHPDLASDINITSSRAGFNYLNLHLKDAIYLDSAEQYKRRYDILYLSKSNKTYIHFKNCDLVMVNYSDTSYTFKYMVNSRDSQDFSKRSYLKLKLQSYLKCY